jgi:hypothetical protein
MTNVSLFLGLAGSLALASVSACSKGDPSSPASEPPAAPLADSVVTPPAPTVVASAPAVVASAPAIVSAPVASAPTLVRVAGRATARSDPTCGDKPRPPCPLYAWMKANTSAAMSAEDFDGLAAALDKVVTFAPAGYENWASIAKDGANAARDRSLDGVKAACRSCHQQYKDKYKKEMRDRPIQ